MRSDGNEREGPMTTSEIDFDSAESVNESHTIGWAGVQDFSGVNFSSSLLIDALKGKVVHHENGIPWDNRPENLETMSPEKHRKIHAQEQWQQEEFRQAHQEKPINSARDSKGRFTQPGEGE